MSIDLHESMGLSNSIIKIMSLFLTDENSSHHKNFLAAWSSRKKKEKNLRFSSSGKLLNLSKI